MGGRRKHDWQACHKNGANHDTSNPNHQFCLSQAQHTFQMNMQHGIRCHRTCSSRVQDGGGPLELCLLTMMSGCELTTILISPHPSSRQSLGIGMCQSSAAAGSHKSSSTKQASAAHPMTTALANGSMAHPMRTIMRFQMVWLVSVSA